MVYGELGDLHGSPLSVLELVPSSFVSASLIFEGEAICKDVCFQPAVQWGYGAFMVLKWDLDEDCQVIDLSNLICYISVRSSFIFAWGFGLGPSTLRAPTGTY